MASDGGSTVPGFAFSRSTHERWADHRGEPDVEAAWADPDSLTLLVSDGSVATDEHDGRVRPRWVATGEAPDGERFLLGRVDGAPRFAVAVDEAPGPHLRLLGDDLGAEDAALAVHAVALDEWHRRNPRCARCGTATFATKGGHERRCPQCGAHHFPRTDPAVIMLVTDDDGRALLGRQPVWPEGRYSTLAGFVEPGETLEDAVRREVAEEAGVRVGVVEYAGSQPWPFPSSLMLGFHARAESFDVRVDGVEIEHARWFSRDDVTAMTASGEIALPGTLSISRWLIDAWHGGTVTGHW